MTAKELHFRNDAREKLLKGAQQLAVVVEKMKSGTGTFGFNAATGSYGDLVALGIIDPVKVVRLALQNAVSSASTLLLTDATMCDVPEPKAKPAGGGGGPEADFG